MKTEIEAYFFEHVARLAKPADAVLNDLDPHKADLWHHGPALMIEAGELADALKKYAIYGKPLNLPNIVEELGDIEFYLEVIRQILGFSREDILAANIKKLQYRYAGGAFSNQAAIERKDKEAGDV